MVDLSEFRTDTRAINDGSWERVNEALYGDLEILSRGFTDAFVDAQNARTTKAAEAYAGDKARIPNSELRQINASLLEDFLVLGVRNLLSGGEAVTVDAFVRLLYDPAYNRLARACWDAAARVSARSVAQIAAAEGNSATLSGSISNGARSEPA